LLDFLYLELTPEALTELIISKLDDWYETQKSLSTRKKIERWS
jgi:hypothetical protein